MPGIAGIISKEGHADAASSVDRMVQCMMHEPFYTSGTYVNGRLGIGVGWTCHPGSFSDCLPVWNERRDIALIFSGEDFADGKEIKRLREKGHEFNPDNASYLVHRYEEMGLKFLEGINGWFSGVLVDLREPKVLLFNDRFGVDRIYYHENAGGLYFASEAKSLLKLLPELRKLDLRSLGEFISCSAILQDRTLFSGVSVAPPGSVWTWSPGQPVRKGVHFNKEFWETQPQLSSLDYYEKLKETWARVLPRYFRGKDRLGLSLTGGVDSRMMLACAHCPPGTLPCYTWGGTYRDCADVKISRQIARICRQPHETIPVGQEFFSGFPSLVEKAVYISDGAMDATGSIDLYVQRKARQIAPVRLSGVYGGEILRRLVMFKPTSPGHGFLDPELARYVKEAAMTYAHELQGHRLSFTAFKQAAWYMTAKFAVERSQVTLRTPYFDNDLAALSYQAPPEQIASNDSSLRLIAEGNPALKKIGTDRGLAFRSIPGVTRALHLYHEFTFKAEYAYDYGMPQWLAGFDHIFAPLHLERLFLGRHKFHHFRVWYRDELAPYLKDILLDSRTRGRPYLHGASLEEMVRSHIEGRRNYTVEIHKALAIELTQRQLVEQQ